MYHLRPLPRTIKALKNEDSDRLRTQYENLPASPDQCVTCHGKKQFLWYQRSAIDADDVTQEGLFECLCEDQWLLHRYLLHCGVGLTYQRLDWPDLIVPLSAEIKEYLNNLGKFVEAGFGLMLYGSMGTGKSLLCNLLLKSFVEAGYDGYFTTFSELLAKMKSGWSSQNEKQWYYRRIKNASILIIDDIGRETQQLVLQAGEKADLRASVQAESTFEEVVRHRVNQAMPTLITSNLDPTKLQQKYGQNVISLLRERSSTVEIPGADWRPDARERSKSEILGGLQRPVVL